MMCASLHLALKPQLRGEPRFSRAHTLDELLHFTHSVEVQIFRPWPQHRNFLMLRLQSFTEPLPALRLTNTETERVQSPTLAMSAVSADSGQNNYCHFDCHPYHSPDMNDEVKHFSISSGGLLYFIKQLLSLRFPFCKKKKILKMVVVVAGDGGKKKKGIK